MDVEVRELPVPEGLVGERLDAALCRLLGLSRGVASDLIGSGAVLVNGAAPPKSARLKNNDWLTIELPAASPSSSVPTTDMEILYDDQDLLVVNKPVGVAAHAGPGWDGPTVLGNLEAAGFRIASGGPPERQGIVQRLDVGTSGAMMVAKSERAYSVLKQAFRDRTVDKKYHAVVSGHPQTTRGTVDAPIGRHPSRQWRMAVLDGGKPARTHYDVVELMPGAALLHIGLETGRTHQIRVHMAALGHPCVGDVFYGADPKQAERLGLERQWLHAHSVGFTHPSTEEFLVVEAPHPADLVTALERLRGNS